MSRKTQAVTLHVAGERLSLRTDRDPALLHSLAKELTQQIDTIRTAAKGVTVQQVYLLVALQNLLELHGEREKLDRVQDKLQRQSKRVLEIIDAELKSNA